ncbi:hypothetical protein B0H14DRAFT_2880966, partial [Mycena olivaceomarginata]
KMTVVHGEPEHIPEEQWLEEEIPSPRRPRPFPTPKATTPTALATRTAASAHATTDAGLHSVMTAEDELLEDDYERICMWTPLPRVDDPMTPTEVQGVAAIQDDCVHQLQAAQQTKIQQRAAEALGRYLEGGKIGQREGQGESICSTSTTPTRFSRCAKWARHRQAEAVWRVLQLEASDQGCKTEGQARAFAESGIRIRRLRGKLDKRRMAAVRAAKHRRNRPIFTSRGSQLGIDRGTNKSMRATD